MSRSSLQVATAQYPIDAFSDIDLFRHKAARWVRDAANRGTELLVFPEYGGMELTSLLPEAERNDLHSQRHGLQPWRAAFHATWRELAMTHGVTLLAPSLPWAIDEDHFVNRAWLFTPDGQFDHQDKQLMTRFERGEWGISPGNGLRVFDTPAGRLGILICYDSEFPLLARALIDAGAEILLVPSCTDTQAGFQRVRLSAQARAIEQQVAVIHSPTIGEALWSPAVDINLGHAAVYTPCDRGFPPDGLLVQSADATPGWQFATLDLTAIAALREHGQVDNHADWLRQSERLAAGIEVRTLA